MNFIVEITATGLSIPSDDPIVNCEGFVVCCWLSAEDLNCACAETLSRLMSSEEFLSLGDTSGIELEITNVEEIPTLAPNGEGLGRFVFFGSESGSADGLSVQ